MNKNIDLDLLRTFLAIQAYGGFSAAGDHIGRTQAAISLQIKKLEEIIGKPVFDRSNRKVTLAPAGEILLEYARKMIDLNDETFVRVSEADISGILRIGAPEAMASTHLPRILSLFNKNHPSVMLDVTCGLTEELLTDFDHGKYDVVIFKRDKKNSRTGNTIYAESLVWVASKDFEVDSKKSIPVILSPQPCIYRKKSIECLEKSKLEWRIAVTAHSLSGRISAMKAGLGITIISKELIDKDMKSLVRNKNFPDPGMLELAMLTDKTKKNSITTRFVEHTFHYFETV